MCKSWLEYLLFYHIDQGVFALQCVGGSWRQSLWFLCQQWRLPFPRLDQWRFSTFHSIHGIRSAWKIWKCILLHIRVWQPINIISRCWRKSSIDIGLGDLPRWLIAVDCSRGLSWRRDPWAFKMGERVMLRGIAWFMIVSCRAINYGFGWRKFLLILFFHPRDCWSPSRLLCFWWRQRRRTEPSPSIICGKWWGWKAKNGFSSTGAESGFDLPSIPTGVHLLHV